MKEIEEFKKIRKKQLKARKKKDKAKALLKGEEEEKIDPKYYLENDNHHSEVENE